MKKTIVNTDKQDKIAFDAVNELLAYDPEKGIFTWKVNRGGRAKAGTEAGAVMSNGYIAIRVNNTLYYAHRLAWFMIYGEWPSKHIDHIDNNPDNNQIANLREATQSENMQNRKTYSNNKSGFKGVSFHDPSAKFRAQIRIDGKNTFIGSYPTAELAHKAYVEAANKHFGEFARAA